MSWGNSATGSASQVLGTCGTWPTYHAAQDEQFGATEQVKATHKGQVAGAVAAIEMIVAASPEGAVLSISAGGSVNIDGISGAKVYINYGISVPKVE